MSLVTPPVGAREPRPAERIRMTPIRQAVKVSFLVAIVIASIVVFFVPTDAKATCYTPIKIHTKYYGWEWNGAWQCDPAIIGPPIPSTLIGERIKECDGSVTTWGIQCTPSYASSTNQTVTTTQCARICE